MNDETSQSQEARDVDQATWFECDDGWGALIAELETSLRAPSPDYTISHVKEEFGRLRYYVKAGDVNAETSKRFYDLIHDGGEVVRDLRVLRSAWATPS